MRKSLSILIVLIVFQQNLFAQHTWLKVAAGSEFAMALRSDSTIWSWGFNGNGQLGNGSTTGSYYPTQIGTDNDWVNITTGSICGFGIKANGTLWAWGFNVIGQLGDGTTNQRLTPVQVGNATNWKTVESGQYHTLALKADNTLWAWGYNFVGQLGLGDTITRHSPVQVDTSHQWVAIATGGYHSLALKSNGTLWGWGLNLNRELGDTIAAYDTLAKLPIQIDFSTDWKAISAGYQYSLALKTNNTLWAWGFNGNGEVGNGTTNQQNLPLQIDTSHQWKKIIAGGSSAYAIKFDSTLYSWGYNGYGELGIGSNAQQSTPTQVGTDKNWASIAASDGVLFNSSVYGLSAYGLKSAAKVICAAGANYQGQLGDSTTASENVFSCLTGSLIPVVQPNGINTIVNELNKLSLYPNPTNSSTTITLTKPVDNDNIKLINLTGQTIIEKQNQTGDHFNLDISQQAQGIYFVEIRQADNVWRTKLVKQ